MGGKPPGHTSRDLRPINSAFSNLQSTAQTLSTLGTCFDIVVAGCPDVAIWVSIIMKAETARQFTPGVSSNRLSLAPKAVHYPASKSATFLARDVELGLRDGPMLGDQPVHPRGRWPCRLDQRSIWGLPVGTVSWREDPPCQDRPAAATAF